MKDWPRDLLVMESVPLGFAGLITGVNFFLLLWCSAKQPILGAFLHLNQFQPIIITSSPVL